MVGEPQGCLSPSAAMLPFSLLPVQAGEWEVESPVPGWLGLQEHVLPHHCREKAFPYKHALVNALFFSFVGLWFFKNCISRPHLPPNPKDVRVFQVWFIPSEPDIAACAYSWFLCWDMQHAPQGSDPWPW